MKNEKYLEEAHEDSQPQKKLSIFRVLIAVLLLCGIVYLLLYAFNWVEEKKVIAAQRPWFAAYVDVTAKPTYAFEQLGATSTSSVVLSFIVSAKDDACTPTWGTWFTMDEAKVELDLDRRIARLQQQEGRVAISFGGAINDELALRCKDHEKLLQAYESVVERYNIDTIDLDLENTGLTDLEAAERRAKVIAQLQQKRRDNGKSLAVWLTIPVAPQGLTQDGTNAVEQMLANGVDLAGVNVMTMDYSNSKDPEQSMYEASRDALIQTHRQLGILYERAEIPLSYNTLWRKIGATPMIGQNDIVGEIFGLQDAVDFNTFTREKGVGRMSMWSANRDIPCGENYVDLEVVSDSCSGTKQEKFDFSRILSDGFDGDLTQNSSIITEEDKEAIIHAIDDPTKSPYQIWNKKGAYLKGTKVVWRGAVYEAKWWTKGDVPDNPVLQAWETPWQLIGPVLPGETPIEQPTLPPETYPAWDGTEIYETGSRVLFDGIPYQSKWWNQGESPAAAASNADRSPWVPLTQNEVEELLLNIISEESEEKE